MKEQKLFNVVIVDSRAGERVYERMNYYYDAEDAIDRLEREGIIYNAKFIRVENYDGEERTVYATFATDDEIADSIYIYELDEQDFDLDHII